jgi:hypothetical protein
MVSVQFPKSIHPGSTGRLFSVMIKLSMLVIMTAGSSFSQVTYSAAGWAQQLGPGPWGNTVHRSSTANATATFQDTGTEAFVIHKTGPNCGIMQVVVDGRSSSMKEIDTYSPLVLWNKKSVIVSDLANGPHTIVVTVTGRKNDASNDSLVQVVDKWTLGRGQWSCEKAWAWYKANPWIVGWNYTPATCVNSIEWWQDETHVSDSGINRELGLGEQLGYNSIIVYLPYIVWVKDSGYLKSRFSRFLAIAAGHNLPVVPVLFDDVNFKGGDPSLGDQGDPVPGQQMSQWAPSPGPTLAVSAAERPGLKRYVQDMVRSFGHDSRVFMWDLYNAPGNSGMGIRTFSLVELAFQWAREVGASQPLICSEWSSYANPWPYDMSDVCTFHGFTDSTGLSGGIAKLRCSMRPIMATEWLARKMGSNILVDLALFKRLGVGCYSRGLINGRMQCQYPWSNPVNGPVDSTGWFHDILYSSGRPYRAEEVDAIRRNLAHKVLNWVPGAVDGSIESKSGCTDPRYSQYDSMATVDNGSCADLLPALVVPGCLDSTSMNYTPLATLNDTAICNAVNAIAPPARVVNGPRQEVFRLTGNTRIRIFGQGDIRAELFNPKGVMIWQGKGVGPCMFDMTRGLKNGVYFLRIVKDGRNVGVYAVGRVNGQGR